MVGVTGFEPATLWSQTRYATGLRYTPRLFAHLPPAPTRLRPTLGSGAPFRFGETEKSYRPVRSIHKKSRPPHGRSADLSGRLDSNQRPPTPEAGALTGLRYTPNKALIILRAHKDRLKFRKDQIISENYARISIDPAFRTPLPRFAVRIRTPERQPRPRNSRIGRQQPVAGTCRKNRPALRGSPDFGGTNAAQIGL